MIDKVSYLKLELECGCKFQVKDDVEVMAFNGREFNCRVHGLVKTKFWVLGGELWANLA